jgi:D-cysteine desulfhydrase
MPRKELIAKIGGVPRTPLGTLPTALHYLPSFSDEVGAEVWIKRDDLTGLALGGNKVRKLEFLLADARQSGADTLVTVGGAQSNHARSVAAVAAMQQMECHLVLGGERPNRPTGNLLLDQLFGADLHFADTDEWDILEKQADDLSAQLSHAGRHPYTMPIGGSTYIGALGFVAAFVELLEQCDAVAVRPTSIVHATSSGGTQAGLEAARQLLGLSTPRVMGVGVAKTAGDLSLAVRQLVDQLVDYLGMTKDRDADVGVLDGFMGPDYAVPTPGANDALSLLARTEGILTDPVYSAKALHAVVELAHGLGGPIVFWHTGGVPALFSDEQDLMRWEARATNDAQREV